MEKFTFHEEKRLEALNRYSFHSNSKNDHLETLLGAASAIFSVPIAVITMVDNNYVRTEIYYGLHYTIPVERKHSICTLAILKNNITVFENAKIDPCLLSNPFVHGEFNLNFYAGAPLSTPDGFNIGMFCILDHVPKSFSIADQLILKKMAKEIMLYLNLNFTLKAI